MTDFGDDFNAADVAPSTGYDVIPVGTYEAEIVESDRQPISKNDDKGDCIVLTWQIRGGPYDGRKVWQRLNLFWCGPEKKPGKVRSISQQQLSAICHATGQIGARNTEALMRRPCLIKIVVRVDPNGRYDDANEVKSVKALGGGQPSRPAGGGQQRAPSNNTGQQRAASPSGSRWERPSQ